MNNLKSHIYIVLSFIVFAVALILTLIWFDWKLFVVIFLFLFANNLQARNNVEEYLSRIFVKEVKK